MRYRSIVWLVIGAWFSIWPLAAHADYLADGRAAITKGDLKAAQINLRNAVRADPQSAEAHYWLSRVSFELGDPVASEREVIAARDRGYDRHQVVPLLAQALLAQSKFDQVLEKLKPSGNDAELDASVLVARGYALAGLKRLDEAREAFTEAERIAPTAVEPLLADGRLAITRGDLATAQSKIDRALVVQPKSVEVLLARAQLLRLRQDAPGAVAVLDGVITSQPGIMRARLERASANLAIGKNDAAKADIDVVLKGNPGSVHALYLRSVMEAQVKDFKAADADLERISPYLGRIDRAYYLQAVVKAQLGQAELAEDAARRYLGRTPDDLAAYILLARIQLARRRPDQVIDTLNKAVESGLGNAEVYDLLGRAYSTTGQGPEAVQSFQKATSLAPADVGMQTRLASVRVGMGDPDAAIGDLEHALTLSPNLPEVSEALFFAALATGDAAKAADALTRIRAAEGQTAVVENLEGVFKLSQADLGGARSTFSEVVRKYPDFPPAKINLARVTMMLGDKDHGEGLLIDVLKSQPTAEPALSMLVSAYLQSNRTPDAIALLERAHRSDPATETVTLALGALYISSGVPQKAVDLASAGQGSAETSVASWGLLASAHLAQGKKQEAREDDTEILRLDPTSAAARRQLAALLVEAGDFEGARHVVTAGIALNPRNYQSYLDLALVDLKSGSLDAALATADRLVGQDEDFAALKALKGDLYMAADRPQDAVAAFSQAGDASPSSLLIARTAGAMLRAKQTDAAVKLLAEWVGKHPDDVTATDQLAQISIATGKWDDAAKYLALLVQQRPHNAPALNNLAWVYQHQGDDARAAPLARQAYALAPGSQTADTLGWILTTSGRAADGVALLRQATDGLASDPVVLFHYAVALKQTGDREAARKALETVVAAKGDFNEKIEAQKLLDDLSKGT